MLEAEEWFRITTPYPKSKGAVGMVQNLRANELRDLLIKE
jgi:hypothetical protein